MPFYRYKCTNCGHEFRFLHLENSDETVRCPKCKHEEVERLLPRVAVQFKGSGFYKTDRAGKSSKAGTAGRSEKSTSTDGESSGEGSSESKEPSSET